MSQPNKSVGIYSFFIEEDSGWDENGLDILVYNAKLKLNFGEFKAGQIVDTFSLCLLETALPRVTATIWQNGCTYNFEVFLDPIITAATF